MVKVLGGRLVAAVLAVDSDHPRTPGCYGSAALIEDLGDRALDVMAIIAEPDRQTPKQHDGDPEQLRFRVFDSVTAFLTNAARRQPLLLIIDDVHQADLASLALLDFLVPQLRTTRAVVT